MELDCWDDQKRDFVKEHHVPSCNIDVIWDIAFQRIWMESAMCLATSFLYRSEWSITVSFLQYERIVVKVSSHLFLLLIHSWSCKCSIWRRNHLERWEIIEVNEHYRMISPFLVKTWSRKQKMIQKMWKRNKGLRPVKQYECRTPHDRLQ